MSYNSASRNPIDWITIGCYLSLLIIGWLMLYAVVYDENEPYNFLDFGTIMGKQSLWIIFSLLAFLFAYSFNWKFWITFAYPVYVVSIILLLAVLIVGVEIKGARSWFSFGGISFQPSEIAKLGTSLALSSYLSFQKSGLRDGRVLGIAIAIIFAPVILILLQPDAGSAVIFMSFFILLYRRGLAPELYFLGFLLLMIFILSLIFSPYIVTVLLLLGAAIILTINENYKIRKTLLILAALLVATVYLLSSKNFYSYAIYPPLIGCIILLSKQFLSRNFRFIAIWIPSILLAIGISFGTRFAFDNFLAPHQKDRINVWLRPQECDPRGSLYNIIQSKLAIGSGGIDGKGFLQGDMTKLNYVPEQTTDFIFSTVGEEQGFIGSIAIILLFLLLISRMILMAERAKFDFIKNFGYCVAGILFFHFFINIGMSMGIMPVIGIPLPFLSKGGSSLMIFSMMIGMMLKMDLERSSKR
ncbi:MAG TPA: rod shape-determining protein RodA [Saprospiraceae bacterium]|nr:rod shape-determining protein RodA [Saprospiraceae bacterium]HPK09137.1 rod shape-determining protein RodA [Saprospiraceae bacterium]HPQ21526.1 rod shape-determining protein RodA [Saprospiraceae bacterium]